MCDDAKGPVLSSKLCAEIKLFQRAEYGSMYNCLWRKFGGFHFVILRPSLQRLHNEDTLLTIACRPGLTKTTTLDKYETEYDKRVSSCPFPEI